MIQKTTHEWWFEWGDKIKIEKKYGLEFNQTLCLYQGTVNVFVLSSLC